MSETRVEIEGLVASYEHEWPQTLLALRDWVNNTIKAIPQEFLSNAEWKAEPVENSDHVCMHAVYNRPATAEEIADSERYERDHLAELLEKYGPQKA